MSRALLSPRTKMPKILVALGNLTVFKFGALGGHSAEAPVRCLLNESKYQSHVRVSVRFRSGSCPGSCPVVSGSRPGSRLGSCLVRVRFVSGLASGTVHVWICVWFVSGLCLVRVRFVSGSCLVCVRFVSGSGPVLVRFVSGSCPVRVWVRVWFASGFASGSCLVPGQFVSGSCWVRVWFVSGSCLVRVWFVSGSYSVGFDLCLIL